MIVDDSYIIKGRGTCVAVHDAPLHGLVPGVLVHQGDKAWVVRAIERRCIPVYQSHVGLLLDSYDVAQYGVPEVGKELNL